MRGEVVSADKSGLVVEVREHLSSPERPTRYLAVQALAKGDRSELAIEMLTELGIDEIVPWQAARSVVRWSGDRAEKSLQRWRSTVREAVKQSRRLRVPEVDELCSTAHLVARSAKSILLWCCTRTRRSRCRSPAAAVGHGHDHHRPGGRHHRRRLEAFAAAGGPTGVAISDGVLRTSTAGVVALRRACAQR